jgi:hypothetical protein
MKKLLATLFVSGMIFSQSFGQISVQVSPSYNFTHEIFKTEGFGLEAGIRFKSTKILRWGFDAGYYAGKLYEPQIVSGPLDGDVFIYSGNNSFSSIQGIFEGQSPIKFKLQALVGIGLGGAIMNVKSPEYNSNNDVYLVYSGHLGFTYRLFERVKIVAKTKYVLGVENPLDLFNRRIYSVWCNRQFTSSNFSLGINYQFK